MSLCFEKSLKQHSFHPPVWAAVLVALNLFPGRWQRFGSGPVSLAPKSGQVALDRREPPLEPPARWEIGSRATQATESGWNIFVFSFGTCTFKVFPREKIQIEIESESGGGGVFGGGGRGAALAGIFLIF